MNVTYHRGYDLAENLRPLFLEYAAVLGERGGEQMRQCLAVQNYDEELSHLEDKYGEPQGRLFLVRCDGKDAGCVAIRKLEEGVCELKRVFLRPEFRGHGVGRAMMEKIIDDARAAGYKLMRLDTTPYLNEAYAVYVKLGFYEIPKYYFTNPVEKAVYMEKQL